MTFCWPSSAALFPLGDRPVQVGTIDPHPAQSGWPDNREIAGCDQIAQRPGADAAVRLCLLELQKPAGVPLPRRTSLRRDGLRRGAVAGLNRRGGAVPIRVLRWQEPGCPVD